MKKAVLISVNKINENYSTTLEHINELEFLAATLEIKTIEKFIQKLKITNPKTYLGSGKVLEVKEYIKINDINIAIFDDELSPSQIKNLEQILECEILDRTSLIFQIFAMRAKTAQAKTQVELAQYQYLLPRLKRMWTHLSRQQGGGANMRGPGEKELETDKRIAQEKISLLKKKLIEIDNQTKLQQKKRNAIVKVALVGYTNVGKSTLMNILAKANVFAENKLFATLDSKVKRIQIKDIPFLLTDTVGFIRKLPHSLIECFKSTIDQIREANIVIHVIDASSPGMQEQIETVEKTLKDIHADKIMRINIFNKNDISYQENEEYIFSKQKNKNFLSISAKNNLNINSLLETLYEKIKEQHLKIYPNYIIAENKSS